MKQPCHTPTRSLKRLCGEDQQTQTRKDRAYGKLSPILSTSVKQSPAPQALRRPAGKLHSRLMRIKGRVDLSEQSSIIHRTQCKDCSNNYTGQTSSKIATRLKEHRSAIRNCNIKASLMAAHLRGYGPQLQPCRSKNYQPRN